MSFLKEMAGMKLGGRRKNVAAAKKDYEDLVGFLKRTGDRYHTKFDFEFSTELFLKQYTSLLETLLLYVAIADGKVRKSELKAIKAITGEQKVLCTLTRGDGSDFTFDGIAEMTPTDLAELASWDEQNLNGDGTLDFLRSAIGIEKALRLELYPFIVEMTENIVDGATYSDGVQRKRETAKAKAKIADMLDEVHKEAMKPKFFPWD